ncbi:hypothetical protein LTR56_012873 [Elasticomyces elasticus]|nr:hypothetical protein LTR56_012873 [Elasticomyces elasticus]KAK3650799.1 hypothetical protein LTR22_012398 [Elasticomyces elasticus]KAK4918503.1 hypothetical protein LTR49_013736 [Elasticomyces elasticus]
MDNQNQGQGEYDQSAAQDAGYAAGRADHSRTFLGEPSPNSEERKCFPDLLVPRSDVGRDAEQGFDSTVQGVENVPSDIGYGY